MSAAEHEAPRRPSSAELVREVAVAALNRTAAPPEHSVTISRNAKGVAQFEVTVRGYDALAVHDEAERIFDTLAASYPYPDADRPVNGGTE